MNLRVSEIQDWLKSLDKNFDLNSMQYMQSDASARKYLRVNNNDSSFVIMDSAPGNELDNFVKIDSILAKHNLNVPQIIADQSESGLLLLNDMGNNTYLSVLNNANQQLKDSLYMDAIRAAAKIQQIPTTNLNLNVMDEKYISDRLEVFSTWYLQRHLGLELDAKIKSMLSRMQVVFNEVFNKQPPVFVHVDYHSRNLMVCEHNNPGILDFQDAMLGPPSYDLVSLLQDAYISLPRSEVESWISFYNELGGKVTTRDFDLVGLQRHIKNLGVFARLHHRDNKSGYLKDMPMLLNYISETCSRYQELTWLLDFITELVN